jgi:CHAT domain-containing protein
VTKLLSDTETKALEFERKGDWALASSFYHEAAQASIASGQLQKAVIYANKSFEAAEKAKDPSQKINAILVLAQYYRNIRQEEKVYEWLQKGIETLKQVPGNKALTEGRIYRHLGSYYMRQEKTQEAIESLSHSLQRLDSLLSYYQRIRGNLRPWVIPNTQHHVILTLSIFGEALQVGGRYEEAIAAYQRGITTVKEYGLKTQTEDTLYRGLGESFLSKKDYPRALQNLKIALDISEKNRHSDEIQRAGTGVGNALLATHQAVEAIPFYQKAIEQAESTRSLLQTQEHRQSYFEGRLDAYRGMVVTLVESHRFEEGFNFAERARSRAFLDLVGNKANLSRVESGLLREERNLQERIAAVRTQLSGEGDSGGNHATVFSKELSEAESAYNGFLAKVRSHDKEQATLMSVEPLTLKQVQELIDPAQTLIEYFVTSTEVFFWVIDKHNLKFQRLAISKNDLAKQVKTLREMISALGDARELNEVSSSLYKSLVQPLVPYITGKEIIIVPHDVLHYLPFQALLGSDGRYLVEKYPITYLSSASLLQFTKQKSRAMGERVLALGNPDLKDPKMSLQYAGIEAKEIKSLYPQSTIYLEKEATEEKAKTFSPLNDIIHFASHAELNESDPLASAILLAKSGEEDGRLEVREIFGMDLKASLVVLSACETGLGKLSSGDELVGLTRAFIYAGTPSVVASLWNVEDSSTAQLMASFYKNLKTMTKVEALRQAQLQLIRGTTNSELLVRRGIGGVGKLGEAAKAKAPSAETVSSATSISNSISTSHPYFWAPFILVGEGK